MGVTGLWKLVEPCGKPVPVETLEGKVLAVDISIWLHQVVKGFQDSKGNALPNAHLLGLFNRLCKLLYYRVKPIFVFDGGVPQLKRDTISKRAQQRGKLNLEADRIENLIVKALAREKVVQQALGSNLDGLLKSPSKRVTKRSEDAVDDIFKLPELPPASANALISEDNEETLENDSSYTTDCYDTTEDSSFEDTNTKYAYDSNLQAIDVRSKHFRELPAEVRHEILVDIKETRKHSWGRLHELPACSNQFSELQMKRLLKRRAVQESLEEVEKELGGRTLTYSELIEYFTEEGVIDKSVMEEVAKPISSDENTRFLLVRNLKKKLEAESEKSEVIDKKEKTLEKIEENNVYETEKKVKDKVKEDTKGSECLGKEYDIDLQLALALSTEDAEVYRKEDYVYDSDIHLRLNAEQRRLLNQAAKGPARSYMIEYAGMNDDEVNDIMEETQNEHNTLDEVQITKLDITKESEEFNNKADVNTDIVEVIDSDTDSELEEVPLNINTVDEANKKSIQIVLDLQTPLTVQDDLFADIFEEEHKKENSPVDTQNDENIIGEDINMQTVKDKAKNLPSLPPFIKQKSLIVKNSTTEITNILDELKKQGSDLIKINLDDIKVSNTIIQLSDDDDNNASKGKASLATTPAKDEIKAMFSTPTKNKSVTKSESPSNKKITEFFETNFVIKRTPDKAIETEVVPKVKSPFFIKKTPTSSRKGSPTTGIHTSKVSKTLFKDDKNNVEVTQQTVEQVIEEAAIVLKDVNTQDELATLATDLAKERHKLESERNRQDRMGITISERMSVDCQNLLRLFGIPYIVAPMEAEAQCAFLDINRLTDGTITDDSDIWLFGGRTVYKDFFATNKTVLEYNADKIEQLLKCDRQRLIQLACLVGSDYTSGVHGIGTVTALEILASFNTKDASDSGSGVSQSLTSVLATLRRFRDWWHLHKTTAAPPGSSVRLALCKKLKNIELDSSFPSMAVIEAYLMPKIDDNREAFSWGIPDLESIREFARKTFGWTGMKTDETLMPVMKKLKEKKSQGTIKNYFAVKSQVLNQQLRVSKRVQSAVNKLSGDVEDTEEVPKKSKRTTQSKRKQQSSNKAGNNSEITKLKKVDAKQTDNAMDENPSVSHFNKIVHKKEIIPQREKIRKQMENSKKIAAEILKKSTKKKP